MQVKTLIKHLQQFPANMEVVFYNGLVDDVQPISTVFTVESLKKHSLKYYENGFLMDWYYTHSKDYTKHPSPEVLSAIKQKALNLYKTANPYVEFFGSIDTLDTKDWFDPKVKKRLVLQARKAGKTYSDRLGKIEY